MKLLIDECVLAETTRILRANGFSVLTIQELDQASASNGTVVHIANQERAVLVTNDVGLVKLNLYPLSSHHGVILLRPRLDNAKAIKDVHDTLLRALKEIPPAEITKSLVIVDRSKYRVRRE